MDPLDAEELKGFGLSTYESAAYGSLLRLGQGDANLVAHKANIPFGRVYDVLNGLVERGLLTVHEGRPKSYRAVAPRAAMSLLLGQRKRELDDRYQELTKLASDLEKRLSPKVKKDPSSFYSASVGEAEARVFLMERIAEAERSMDINLEVQPYRAEDKDLFDEFAAALDRGVRVRILVRDSDIPNIAETPIMDEIAARMIPHVGKGLDVRVVEAELVPFGIIDDDKAIIGVKSPVDPRSYFATVYIRDPKFASQLAARFDEAWASATVDAADVLGRAGTDGIDLSVLDRSR